MTTKMDTPKIKIGSKICADHDLNFPYTRLPLSFFTNDLYRELTETAKLLYTILFNFHEFSCLEETDSKFIDSDGFVFVLIEYKELGRLLNVSQSTVQRALQSLSDAKLIERGEKVDKLRKIYLLIPEVAESTSMFYKTETANRNLQLITNDTDDEKLVQQMVGSRIKKGVKLNYLFVKVPMFLFTNNKYRKISAIAKLVLPILIDLHEYSRKSRESKKYRNNDGHVFMLISQMQIASILNISRASAKKAIKELSSKKLVLEGNKIQSVYTLYLLHPEKTEHDSIFKNLDHSVNPVRLVNSQQNKPKIKIVFQDPSKDSEIATIGNTAKTVPVSNKNEIIKSSTSKWSNITFSSKKRDLFVYTKTFITKSGLKLRVTNWKKPLVNSLKFKYTTEVTLLNMIPISKNDHCNAIKVYKNEQNKSVNMQKNDYLSKVDDISGAKNCIDEVSFSQNFTGQVSNSVRNNHYSALDYPVDYLLDNSIDQASELSDNSVNVYRSKPINQNDMPLLDENNPIFINQYLKDSEKRFNSKIISALKFSHSNNCFHVYELSTLVQKAFDDVCAGKWYVGNYSKFVKANANERMELNSYFYSEDFASENGEAGLLSPMIGEAISTAIYRALRHIAGNKNQRPVNDPSSYIYTALNKDLVDLFLRVQMQY